MPVWICRACGVEHPETRSPPDGCPICLDERQYVPSAGQQWTTHADLARSGHRGSLRGLEAGLTALVVTPRFGIGHRGLLLAGVDGAVLWEPPGYLDDELVGQVRAAGGLVGVAASHPHLVGAAVSWAREFGVPFWFNAADHRWLMRPDPLIRWWTDRQEIAPGITVVRCGGHFPGSAVLHWPAGAGGRGVLLVGDTLMVGADLAGVSFMRSYPNMIPLPARLVRQIAGTVDGLAADRIYGGFEGSVIDRDARAAVARSAHRYIGWLQDELRDPDEPAAVRPPNDRGPNDRGPNDRGSGGQKL